jgi:hypothetical protein
MKYSTIVPSLLAALAYASPIELEAQDVQDISEVHDFKAESPFASTQDGFKVLARLASSPAKDGALRAPQRWGPYTIQSSKMVQQWPTGSPPCTACYITAMEPSIRYGANLTSPEANVDTGAWLHHIALFGPGAGGASIWAAGNERPTIRLNEKYKYGLDLSVFTMMVDLMSEDSKPKPVYLFINFEYIPKMKATGYKTATMYWLTVGEPAARTGKYKFDTQTSSIKTGGKLLYSIGHMHDGGTDMKLYVMRGGTKNLVCTSIMHYNARQGYGGEGKGAKAGAPGKAAGGAMAGMSHGRFRRVRRDGPHGTAGEHISDPGACTTFDVGGKDNSVINAGDSIKAEAWYDSSKHPLMVHNGAKEKLMGNMRVYIGQ